MMEGRDCPQPQDAHITPSAQPRLRHLPSQRALGSWHTTPPPLLKCNRASEIQPAKFEDPVPLEHTRKVGKTGQGGVCWFVVTWFNQNPGWTLRVDPSSPLLHQDVYNLQYLIHLLAVRPVSQFQLQATTQQQAFLLTYATISLTRTHIRIYLQTPNATMPFFYSKPIGGRNFGTSVHADRHGVRRGPWRFRIGRFHCFR
ncbi:hypothetical protein CDEST_00204 [Colletotrichum destructivum]|nr:hypothetical protein CDEST_00204 [Colletotrichum destructivum]